MWPLVSSSSSASVGLFKVHLPPFVSAVIASVHPEARTDADAPEWTRTKCVCLSVSVCVCTMFSVNCNFLLITSPLSLFIKRIAWGSSTAFKDNTLLFSHTNEWWCHTHWSVFNGQMNLLSPERLESLKSLFFSGWFHLILSFFSGNLLVGVL